MLDLIISGLKAGLVLVGAMIPVILLIVLAILLLTFVSNW